MRSSFPAPPRAALLAGALCVVASPALLAAELGCIPTDAPPSVDGHATDAAWSRAEPVTSRDPVARIDVTLRCLYTDERLYLLASFPDETENRRHKTHVWDEADARYRIGPAREDTLVFKWSMEPGEVDLTLSADEPYQADVWFWKAYRTDGKGYADDKHHIYTNEPVPRSKKLLSKSGRRFYLLRRGDAGESAYRSRIHVRRDAAEMPGYELRTPSGSRADVAARGRWADGVWHVELARDLQTGEGDDVQFAPDRRYRFGVSRYEIAGGKVDPSLEVPPYAAGEIGEPLELVFRPPLGAAR